MSPLDDDGYWTEIAQRTGSNSAIEGIALLKSFIESGTASESALRGMAAVLLSLSQACRDQLAERREAAKRSRTG